VARIRAWSRACAPRAAECVPGAAVAPADRAEIAPEHANVASSASAARTSARRGADLSDLSMEASRISRW
jgi:hypothetical protein